MDVSLNNHNIWKENKLTIKIQRSSDFFFKPAMYGLQETHLKQKNTERLNILKETKNTSKFFPKESDCSNINVR